MGISDNTKYEVMLKIRNGEYLTSSRSWLVYGSALEYMINSLNSGVFSNGAIVHLDLNGALKEIEEFTA